MHAPLRPRCDASDASGLRSRGVSRWPLRIAVGVALCAPLAAGAASPRATLAVEGMTYVGSRGGQVEVVLDAARADFRGSDDVVQLEDVHLRVVEREGVAGFDLRCRRGALDLQAGDFDAEGDVRGRTADGRELRTERLAYRRAAGLVRSDAPVEIRDAIGLYRGAGFEYHVREARFRLLGGARVRSAGAPGGEP